MPIELSILYKIQNPPRLLHHPSTRKQSTHHSFEWIHNKQNKFPKFVTPICPVDASILHDWVVRFVLFQIHPPPTHRMYNHIGGSCPCYEDYASSVSSNQTVDGSLMSAPHWVSTMESIIFVTGAENVLNSKCIADPNCNSIRFPWWVWRLGAVSTQWKYQKIKRQLAAWEW